jgi:hypothetical protein
MYFDKLFSFCIFHDDNVRDDNNDDNDNDNNDDDDDDDDDVRINDCLI